MTTIEATFTVRAAVMACQVSEKTIRRQLPALQEHGATVDDRGRWTIPWSALVAVGLKPGKPAGPDAGHVDQDNDQVTNTVDQAKKDADQAEIRQLTSELAARDQVIAAKDEVIAAKDQTIASKDEVIAWARLQLPPGALEGPRPAIATAPAIEVISTELAEAMPAPTTEVELPATVPAWRDRFKAFFGKK